MKTFLLIVFFSVFVFSASGQRETDQPASPFQISFELKKNRFCTEEAAEFTTKLVNTSDKPVTVDLNKIGALYLFDRINKKTEGESFLKEGPLLVGLHYRPDYLTLQPQDFFTRDLKFVFNDSFFNEGRRFSMQIGYGQSGDEKFENSDLWRGVVFSNPVNILVKKCD